ncbi:MAG TPA: porin, partial [Kiloniellales bacterium]|nr:porin [Kiloniellales bacterium]
MKKKYSVVAFGVAAAGVMAAGSAQALALYENDTTKFDLYGRVHLLLERDNAGVDFENQSSRLGFRLSHKITEGLTAFARSEIR